MHMYTKYKVSMFNPVPGVGVHSADDDTGRQRMMDKA